MGWLFDSGFQIILPYSRVQKDAEASIFVRTPPWLFPFLFGALLHLNYYIFQIVIIFLNTLAHRLHCQRASSRRLFRF